MAANETKSILVADIGNAHTRLVLFNVVEGQYRLLSAARTRTTADPPLRAAALGLEHAAEAMSERIGRELLGRAAEQFFLTPESDGHGVDAFLATTSYGKPMKVFLVGLTPEISLTSGRRVLGGSYVQLVDTLNPDDVRNDEERINAILANQPDLILIVGGTDNGADDILLEQVRVVQTVLELAEPGHRPNVLFAGNEKLRGQVREMLSELTQVFVTRNVRPTLDDERLFTAQVELALAYDDFRTSAPGGLHTIAAQSKLGVMPTAQGYINTLRYMSEVATPRQGTIGPLCVDVGSANSMIFAGVNGQTHFTIRTDLGVGHNMSSAIDAVTPDNVRNWLTYEISDDALLDAACNKELRPVTVPTTTEDLLLEQALARAIIEALLQEAHAGWDAGPSELLPQFQPIVGAGAILTQAQHPAVAALLLLDALQPVGITDLKLDPHGVLPALGMVAYLNPVATVQAIDTGGLVHLATVFSPLGRLRAGQEAMRVHVRPAEGRPINRIVRSGQVWRAPLLPGITAEVDVRLNSKLRLNGKRRIKRTVTVGTAGIIFDARGRPLTPIRARDRVALLRRWLDAMQYGDDVPPPVTAQPAEKDNALPDIDDLAPEMPSFEALEG